MLQSQMRNCSIVTSIAPIRALQKTHASDSRVSKTLRSAPMAKSLDDIHSVRPLETTRSQSLYLPQSTKEIDVGPSHTRDSQRLVRFLKFIRRPKTGYSEKHHVRIYTFSRRENLFEFLVP